MTGLDAYLRNPRQPRLRVGHQLVDVAAPAGAGLGAVADAEEEAVDDPQPVLHNPEPINPGLQPQIQEQQPPQPLNAVAPATVQGALQGEEVITVTQFRSLSCYVRYYISD